MPGASDLLQENTILSEANSHDDRSAVPPPPRPPLSSAAALDGLLAYVPASRGEPTAASPPPPGYVLLEELGRGGMGVVFKARQIELNRFVAAKTIRTGILASAEEQLRFRTEAQAVARLHHPNIIQIYDVGETAGHAYLILEYAEGGSLARRLDAGPLIVREAVALLYTLAQAVHYAHGCGIIHRDLKPANVLLAAQAPPSAAGTCGAEAAAAARPLAEWVPKIADFGLAKLLGEDSQKTQTGAVVGTPSYMAPEQALGHAQEVEPATDVYALGAMLYEMLTARPPFRGTTPLQTLEQVRTCEPVPLRQLQVGIPRDVETICLKCLQKDARRRYPSAAALADDLRRFLEGVPILARPVSVWERGIKWMRRRPLVATLAACILAATVALVGVGLSYQFELERSLGATRQQRDRAELYYGKMLEAVDSLLSEVGDKDLADIPEMEEARNRLFEKALQFHEGLLREGGDDPTSRLHQARLFYRIALLNHWSSKNEHAVSYAQRAIALCRQLVAEAPDSLHSRKELAKALTVVGSIYRTMNRHADEERCLREGKEICEALPLAGPQERAELAETCAQLAFGLLPERPEEAEPLFRQALELLQDTQSVPGAGVTLLQVYLGQGLLHQKYNRAAEAKAAYRKGLNTGQAALRDARWVGLNHFNVAQMLHNLATLEMHDAPQESETLLLKSLDLCEQLTRRHPKLPMYARQLLLAHDQLAMLYLTTMYNKEKAEQHLRAAVKVHLSGAVGSLFLPVGLARDLDALGMLCAQTNRLAEAETELKKAIPVLEPLVKQATPDPEAVLTLARTYFLLGYAQQQDKRPADALKSYECAIALLEPLHRAGRLPDRDQGVLQACQGGRAEILALPKKQ